MVGLERRNEDFGQTLGYWGLGQGPYLMLPFLGPSTPRELGGMAGDYVINPLWDVEGSVTLPLTGCLFTARCPMADEQCPRRVPHTHSLRDGTAVACHYVSDAWAPPIRAA